MCIYLNRPEATAAAPFARHVPHNPRHPPRTVRPRCGQTTVFVCVSILHDISFRMLMTEMSSAFCARYALADCCSVRKNTSASRSADRGGRCRSRVPAKTLLPARDHVSAYFCDRHLSNKQTTPKDAFHFGLHQFTFLT